MGRRTKARTRLRPRNRTRASSQASGTPSRSETATAAIEHTSESRSAHESIRQTVTLFVAQSGVEDEIGRLVEVQKAATLANPFSGLSGLAGRTVLENVVLGKDNRAAGEYTVRIPHIEVLGPAACNVTIESTGWVPSASATNATHRTVTVVVRMSLSRSKVFDYAYFINNWGWYYGDTIVANGNVRSNGQFDGGGYASTVNPLPRFQTVDGTHLSNPLDAGGLYSGWNVVGAGRVKGISGKWTAQDVEQGLCRPEEVGQDKYVHSYTDPLVMPNLTNLEMYEELAKSKQSSIRVGDTVVSDGVVGDQESGPNKENPNLYLVGTKDQPIVIDGPIVVRGDVIISGYVTGKGGIYAGGNIYVAGDIIYKNPAPAFPVNKDSGSLQNWLALAQSADALGLFAREHIVVGNYKQGNWTGYVKPWVNDPRNASEEDAGMDGIPNTYVGRDGIRGTADDDVLEGDDVWTVNRYTAEQMALGLVPEGRQVGDVIPETGEDIDGDGQHDPTVAMTEFELPPTLLEINNGHWQGILPQGQKKYTYADLSNNNITRLDAAFYTNHTFAMLTTAAGKDLAFNGCIVSRNEAIIYGTKSLTVNYDLRLLDGGETFGFYLPITWQPIQVLVWNADGTDGTTLPLDGDTGLD